MKSSLTQIKGKNIPKTVDTPLTPSPLPVKNRNQMSVLKPLGESAAEQTYSYLPSPKKLPVLSVKEDKVETLMKLGNKTEKIEIKTETFENRDKVLPLNSSVSKVVDSGSTAEFSTFEGIQENQDIEKALLDRGFISIEKILTKDDFGNIICNFIKARDKLGHVFYVELDTNCDDGFGFLMVSENDQVFTKSDKASIVPYSLKVGSFEASNSDLYGVGFECDNSICVMSRKDNSLEPVETVFTHTKESGDDMGIQDNHPIPFPVVKLSEILSNPKIVQHNITCSHNKMRNIAFNSCNKDVLSMKRNLENLEKEINKFAEISNKVSSSLSSSISQLEKMHDDYEKRGTRCNKDVENLRCIRFNLNKRHELFQDYTAMCHSMRERSEKIAVLSEELRSLNEFAETLFTGLSSVFTE